MAADGSSDARNGYTVAAHPSDIDRAVFLGDVATDNLHSAFMALAGEVWSMRRRQKVVEALLATRGIVTAHAIETFVPSAEQELAWRTERDAFVKAIYDPLQRHDGIAYHSSLRPDGPTDGGGI